MLWCGALEGECFGAPLVEDELAPLCEGFLDGAFAFDEFGLQAGVFVLHRGIIPVFVWVVGMGTLHPPPQAGED